MTLFKPTLEDLDAFGQRLADCRFHLDLYRTKNPEGRWECRLQPYNFDDLEGDMPYGRSHDLWEAIKAAVEMLPQDARETMNAFFKDWEP